LRSSLHLPEQLPSRPVGVVSVAGAAFSMALELRRNFSHASVVTCHIGTPRSPANALSLANTFGSIRTFG
jgi:hypothetical protein